MVKLGTMCPVNVVGSPGILMSHMCVDLICLPSGRLIVSGYIAGRLFFTSAPSMIKIDVAPVSAIASDVAILSLHLGIASRVCQTSCLPSLRVMLVFVVALLVCLCI